MKPFKTLASIVGIVAVLGALTACAPLAVINAVTPTSTYHKTGNLAYGTDARDRLDVYTPAGQTRPAPVVVFFYGGNWNSGERGDYAFVGQALASRGIVAVIADYRLYPQVRYPDFLTDSAKAVAWAVREVKNYGGDPQQLFVMGHSAGGYNAAMVALDERLLAAQGLSPAVLRGWIGLAGPYDFTPIENPDTRPVFLFPNTPAASQPVNHVTPRAPRTLLIASNKDRLVDPQRNTGGLAKRLRSAAVPVSEVYFDHTTHTTLVGAISLPLRGLAPVLDTIDAFVHAPDQALSVAVPR
ncbi:MAG: alpha/beta hydrolase [Janthinobacterium lividum]